MATRQKKLVIAGDISIETANEQFGIYSDADARIRRINAGIDMAITKIRDKYANELTELSEKRESAFDMLHAFGMKNKELFTAKRSMEFSHGILGFRTGTPKLKVKKGFTWASILEILKVKMPEYIRTVEEVNKEKILVNRELPEVANNLPSVGVMIDQDETFFVQPKQEEIPV